MGRRTTSWAALATALAGAALLAGCTAGAHTASSTATASASASASATQTATASATPTATATGAASATPGSSPSGNGAASASSCATKFFVGTIGERNGAPAGAGDGMNQKHDAIILSYTGSTTCTLQGWPGVSFVGDGNGTQLGAPATLDWSAPHPTLTIKPGGKVQAPIDYSNADVYAPSECQEKLADGFRVYPPGSRTSIFIPEKWEACTSTQHKLLTVGAFVAYP